MRFERERSTRLAVYPAVAVAVALAMALVAGFYFPINPSGPAAVVSQTATSQTSYPANSTFKFGALPQDFAVGGYRYHVICDYIDYCTYVYGGSTVTNLGVALVFVVSRPSGESQTAVFGWPAYGPTSNQTLPSPSNVSLFNGCVTYDWFGNGTGLYMSVVTRQC